MFFTFEGMLLLWAGSLGIGLYYMARALVGRAGNWKQRAVVRRNTRSLRKQGFRI